MPLMMVAGSLLLVPLYHKIGRRAVMLGSLVFVCEVSRLSEWDNANCRTVLRWTHRLFAGYLV